MFFVLLFFSLSVVNAQRVNNLVVNPIFDWLDSVQCITTGNYSIREYVGWGEFGVLYTLQNGNLGLTSPDAFNFDTCGNHPEWNNHVPLNSTGYQFPKRGNGYIGFKFQRGREWPTGSFVQPLTPGKTYCAEMHVNIAETFSTHGTKSIQMMLHTDSVLVVWPWSLWGLDSAMNAYYDTIQPITFYSDFITDTLHWTKITTHFVADSAYRFFTIGNFKRTDHFDTIALKQLGPFSGITTYLFLDDVLIYDCSDTIPPPEPQFDFEVKAYPNPASESFNFEYTLPEAGKVRLHITDVFGKMVLARTELAGQKGINTLPIDVNAWAMGQYHVSVLYEAHGQSAYRHMKMQVVR